MTQESRIRRLEALFDECVELAPAARLAFLDANCAGDPGLRDELEDLLRRDAESAGAPSIASPFLEAAGAAVLAPPPPPVIGAYHLGEKLGEGGFGEVYEAEQTAPVRRRVAIKILKPGMDSAAVLARFEAERQSLAVMDHPGIAKVYDAGVTETGRSYFVMERVVGENVSRVCDERRLSLRARLELFTAVCRAVEHAHTKGVIHRDLKPSNILVTVVDGALQPKVIDFGIAKATAAALGPGVDEAEQSGPRTLRGEILGTPEYMSPEQAASFGADVDTRSDVYSLGAVLFRMLTGRVPFLSDRLRAGDFETMRRILLEEEPPRPSEIAASPGAPASAITGRELRGDLDWIVLRALEKDRERRYPSAAALADDIERHLRDDPIQAGAPTTMDRLVKLVRRHRVLVASAAAVAIALVAGIAATATQAVRAIRAEERARHEAEVATAVNEFLGRMLAAGDPLQEARGRELTVLEVVERAAREVDANPPRIPAVEAGIRSALASTFLGLGEYDSAESQLTRADAMLGDRPEPNRSRVEARLQRAQLFALRRLSGAADSILAGVEPELRTFAAGDPELKARYTAMRGAALANVGRLLEADSLFAETLAMRRAASDRDAGNAGRDALLAEALSELAEVRRKQGRLDEAEPLAREALDVAARSSGPGHFDVASAQVRLASVLTSAGEYAEADSLLSAALGLGESILGPDHPLLAEWITTRAQVSAARGALPEAEESLRRALDILRRAGIAGSQSEATIVGELATVLQLRGALDESLRLRLRELEISSASGRDLPEQQGKIWNNVGSTYRLMKRYAEAESAFVEALEGFRAAPDGDPSNVYIALHNLGKTKLDRGSAREAQSILEEAAPMGPKVLPDGHPSRAIFATTYGRALAATGRTQEARRWLLEAREGLRAALGPDHPRTKEAEAELAKLEGK